jgi:hypothetical protein
MAYSVGGGGGVCSSVQWLYELSAQCQPAAATDKGEGLLYLLTLLPADAEFI